MNSITKWWANRKKLRAERRRQKREERMKRLRAYLLDIKFTTPSSGLLIGIFVVLFIGAQINETISDEGALKTVLSIQKSIKDEGLSEESLLTAFMNIKSESGKIGEQEESHFETVAERQISQGIALTLIAQNIERKVTLSDASYDSINVASFQPQQSLDSNLKLSYASFGSSYCIKAVEGFDNPYDYDDALITIESIFSSETGTVVDPNESNVCSEAF